MNARTGVLFYRDQRFRSTPGFSRGAHDHRWRRRLQAMLGGIDLGHKWLSGSAWPLSLAGLIARRWLKSAEFTREQFREGDRSGVLEIRCDNLQPHRQPAPR